MAEFINSRPKARKPHVCQMCGRTIRPGELYRRGVGLDDGTAWTWKECLHCEQLVRYVNEDESYDDDLINEWAPETIGHARLRAQYRRKWQRFDGSLYPLPRTIWHEDRHGFRHAVNVEPS